MKTFYKYLLGLICLASASGQVPKLDERWQMVSSNSQQLIYANLRGDLWGISIGQTNTFEPPPLPAPIVPVNLWSNIFAHVVAQTNGRTMQLFTTNTWTGLNTAPVTVRDTNSLVFGAVGFTGFTVHNNFSTEQWSQAAFGQIQGTALTRRHVIVRGHGFNAAGVVVTNGTGRVWFVTATNTMVERLVLGVIGFDGLTGGGDFSFLFLNEDLPESIEPVPVLLWEDFQTHLGTSSDFYLPFFACQHNQISVVNRLPGFNHNNWVGGDSGSANLVLFPHPTRRFVMSIFSIRSGSVLTPQVLEKMDLLTTWAGLNPANYQPTIVNVFDYQP